MPHDQDQPTGAAAQAPRVPSGTLIRRQPGTAGRSGREGWRETGRPGWTVLPGWASRRGRSARTDPVVWLIALATFATYTIISVQRERRLDPGTWDLGIFTEYIRQYSLLHAPVVPIKGHNFNLLGDHFTPIVALVAPVFRIFPSPVTLLVVQAALVSVSVVPVCRVARERLGTGPSRAIGLAYGFSWGLQQMINFAFHELAFAVPLLAFAIAALLRRRPWAAVAWALPLVFVKEDQGVTVAAIGVVMLGAAIWARARDRHGAAAGGPVRGGGEPGTTASGTGLLAPTSARNWAWAGGLLIVWGLGWSAVEIMVIIPYFNPLHHYAYWKDGGAIRPGNYFPLAGIVHQLTRGASEKLSTTALLLLPVVFLALASPVVLVAVPGLALRFISVHQVFWGTSFHYNAPVMPIVFLAAIDGLVRISARATRAGWLQPATSTAPVTVTASVTRPATAPAAAAPPRSPVVRVAAGAMVAVAALLALEFPLSHLWAPRIYVLGPHVRAEYAAMARVPDGVTVEASEGMLAPLAARDLTSWTRNRGIHDPQYVVLDTKQQNGFHTRGSTPLRAVERIHHGAVYRQIFSDRHVYVFRLVANTDPGAASPHPSRTPA